MTARFTPPDVLPLIGAAILIGIHMEAAWKIIGGWTVGAAIISTAMESAVDWGKMLCFREAVLLAMLFVGWLDPEEQPR
jgi:hypothetical protein